MESEGVDLDQSEIGVLSSVQSLFELLLLLLLGERTMGGTEANDTRVERGRWPDLRKIELVEKLKQEKVKKKKENNIYLECLFGEICDDFSGVLDPFSLDVVAVEGSSRVSSSEKSVEPSSCEICQSMLTFSNIIFFRWRACIS